MTRQRCFAMRAGSALLAVWFVAAAAAGAAEVETPSLAEVSGVELQPLVAATRRLVEALKVAGAPLPDRDERALADLLAGTEEPTIVRGVQRILDPHCLAMVTISAESRVSVVAGPAPKELVQQGWRTFLVKVANEAGVTSPLRFESPNVAPIHRQSRGEARPSAPAIPAGDIVQRFLDAAMLDKPPLTPTLSGLKLEYRVVQLFSRDAGRREAALGFHVGQGTQDVGVRHQVPMLFDCRPAVPVTIGMRDADGAPTIGWLVVKDAQGRVYPNPARRLAPDFFFHRQVYRADGEELLLPPGDYTVEAGRGPEYEVQRLAVTVTPDGGSQRIDVALRRWIHLAKRHWYSGDHHVHAAGCSHYETPREGVTPADMIRHLVGEDLNVGCVLSWGPCWYAQKEFFDGGTHPLSRPVHLMRYDVEVSGFPSAHAGHLCLLRLKEDDFPGTTSIEEWPSWTLPVNRWAREQGGVVGYSHSGWGLQPPDVGPGGGRVEPGLGRAPDVVPDYAMPKFDGIGANEFIVTGPLDACDFISAVDTPAVWELSIWYHVLNCGLRTRISGETDFPCIYDERVGLGRVYVKMPGDRPLDFDAWVDGLRDGRSYCSEGRCHVVDFEVNGVKVGEPGPDGRISQVVLDRPGRVTVRFDAAALLEPEVTPATEAIRSARLDAKPYWHVERARIGAGRTVPVEIVVNGEAVARRELVADGGVVPFEFDVEIERSSWLAVRVFPAAHTNPVWIEVDGKPVRPSRRSARWCLDAVDVCWKAKERGIRAAERPAAREAYDRARAFYAAVAAEAAGDDRPVDGAGTAAATRVPKVLLVGIDGCRADAARKVAATAFAGMLDGAAVTYDAQNLPLRIVDAETSSGPSWASVLSGAFPDKHGWLDDVRRRQFNGRFPHFLARVEAARPAATTVSIVTWPDVMAISAAADVNEKAASDAEAEEKALLHLTRGGSDAMFVHLDHVDATGHAKGFSPDNADYLAAIEETGKRVARLVEATRRRSAEHPDEDWLVIVTSDHGGHGNGHNSHRHVVPDIRRVPFLVIGRAADPAAIAGQVYTVDAAATALVHLGLPLDADWQLDGVPVGLAGHPPPATSRPDEPAATEFIRRKD